MDDFPLYPSGLRLTGRRVVVVGGGHVAQRRVPQLISVGADVHVVSPEVTPAIEGMVGAGEITWHERGFAADDLDQTWYVIAATDDHDVNEEVSAAADARRIFCVRSDDATRATAWTPAVGRHAGVTVAVLGQREPQRSAAVRDEILEGLREGTIVARHQRDRTPGVVLVGGGPGDPDLISVAGRKALMEADLVVADRLAPRELLGELPADVELVDVAKLPRGRSAQQEEINRIIVQGALAGKSVVRFKGGDNFVFGRGYEEVIACREAGVPVTVIPGLSSSVSVPAVAGIPVTHRGITHEFTVVSGHLPPGHPESLVNWPALGQLSGTVVLMMAVENAPAIAAALVDGGRKGTTPVAVVCDGTMPGERTVLATLDSLADELAAHAVRPPAIIVVGEVVAVAHPDRFS
jgi:uroporphyrin-III C-methyltransferase / precorrin-2 dehydrogenase / sirohydrochlorin ferrochelatase